VVRTKSRRERGSGSGYLDMGEKVISRDGLAS